MNVLSRVFCRALLASSLLLGAGCLSAAWAQPSTGGPAPQAPAAVPFDGGASLLLAAGVGLGLRRLRQGRRAKV